MPSVQGFRGSATFGGALFTVHRWSIDWRADVFDATNMKQTNAGAGIYRGGLMDVDVSADLFHDSADDPFNPALGTSLVPGTFLAMRLDLDFGNVVTTLAYLFPSVLVVSSREDVSVRDITRISMMGKVNVARLAATARAAAVLQPFNFAAP